MCLLRSKVVRPIAEPVDEDSPQLETITSATNTCTTRLVGSLCEDDTTKSDNVIKILEINKESKTSKDLNWYDSSRDEETNNLTDTKSYRLNKESADLLDETTHFL